MRAPAWGAGGLRGSPRDGRPFSTCQEEIRQWLKKPKHPLRPGPKGPRRRRWHPKAEQRLVKKARSAVTSGERSVPGDQRSAGPAPQKSTALSMVVYKSPT